MSKSVKGQ
jgi:hypothetical protein